MCTHTCVRVSFYRNGELDEDTAKAYLIKVVDLMLVNKYKDAESVVRPWSVHCKETSHDSVYVRTCVDEC